MSTAPRRRSSAAPSAQRMAAQSDPFAHISLVHSFVGDATKECTDKRFLICLRDHLPIVGVERGADILERFFRKHFCAASRVDLSMLTRNVLFQIRRRMRCRRKLRELIRRYAAKRRAEVDRFVKFWSVCEQETQRSFRVSFLEYATAHVPLERKRRVAALVRVRYVHRWVRRMRHAEEALRLQSDNFYLWVARGQLAVSSGAYFALKSVLLSGHPQRRCHPVNEFYHATIRELVVEDARERFAVPLREGIGNNNDEQRESEETALLRRLVLSRTQRESIVNPDLLLQSAFLKVQVVAPEFRPPLYEESVVDQLFFADPPPTHDAQGVWLPPPSPFALWNGSGAATKPSQQHQQQGDSDSESTGCRPSSSRSNSLSFAVSLVNSTAARKARKSSAFRNTSQSKTTICMVGLAWLDHPEFQGNLHHLPVLPPSSQKYSGDNKDVHHRLGSPDGSDLGDWRSMVQQYEVQWEDLRRSTVSPKGAPQRTVKDPSASSPLLLTARTPVRHSRGPAHAKPRALASNTAPALETPRTPRAPLFPSSSSPRNLSVVLSGIGPTSTRVELMPRQHSASISHSRFCGSHHHRPFPALQATVGFSVPTSNSGGGGGHVQHKSWPSRSGA